MRAIRKKNNYFFKLSEEVYDLDGNEYLWKDLILCPEDDEQVNYRLEQLEIEKLRQEYAGMAMLGIMAFRASIDYTREKVAKLAVQQADALIAELTKKKG